LNQETRLEVRAKKQSIKEIVDKIYILESSGGKNDHCLKEGLKNGYGFRVNKREQVCYQSHEEVRTEVELWISNRMDKMTLAEMLCVYNKGLKVNNCTYYKKFLNL